MGFHIAKMVIGSKYDAPFIGGIHHRLSILDAHGEWLFAKDMLSCLCSGDGLVMMLLVCRRDIDGVNAGICEKIGQRGGLPLEAQVFRERSRPLFVTAVNRD